MKLYHNALSTCSQKVRMVLAEKGLEFESQLIDLVGGGQHDPEYVKLNPKHVVPTLIAHGTVIRESSIINEYIEDITHEDSLSPEDPILRAQMRMWIKRIDDDLHGKTTGVFTHGLLTRNVINSRSEEEQESYFLAILDPAERELRRSVMAHGVDAPEFESAIQRMADYLTDVEISLAQNKWLVGDQFTLADVCLAPYIVRLETTMMDGFWTNNKRPGLERWLADVRARDSYKSAFDEWVPKETLEFLQSIVEPSSVAVRELIAKVDRIA